VNFKKPFVLSLSKCAVHASTSSARTVAVTVLRNAHEITWASSCFDRLSTNGGGV